MEKKIQKIFIDKRNQIYVIDDNNVLYLYEDELFYPFMGVLYDVKKCFAIDNKFYVFYSNTIAIFDENLYELNFSANSWLTYNVDQICYDENLDVIIILGNGRVYVNLDISDRYYYEDNDYKTLVLNSNSYANTFPHKIEEIKLIGNLLLTYENKEMNIYHLSSDYIKFVSNINITRDVYLNIRNFDKEFNAFELENGSMLNMIGEYSYIDNIGNLIDYTIFSEQKIFFVIRDEYLICLYDMNRYNDIVKPLINNIPVVEVSTSEFHSIHVTTYFFPKDDNMIILNGITCQIISYNSNLYLIDTTLKMIVLKDESIDFTKINEYCEKTEIKLVIDINIDIPIMDQISNIIPSIYRLNNEMLYCFEQVDSNSKIISYGEGVTRHVFSTLRKEIDIVLQNNLSPLNKTDCFKLGKLIYFCNKDGGETFFHISPYFFYALSLKGIGIGDHITLLKNFKGANFNLLYKQYIQYSEHPEELDQLDMDIKTLDDFIKFLFMSNLKNEQIELYDELVKGYCFFAHRGRFHQLIKRLPVSYHIQRLINLGYFDAELDFSTKNTVDLVQFTTFRSTFKQVFGQLTQNEKSYFVQNITGTHYYTGVIKIIYAYETQKIVTQQNIYDENIIIDEERPIEAHDNIVIDLSNDRDLDKKIAYEISTCHTQITVNTSPTKENVTNLIKMLIIEDTHMKN